MGKKTSRRKLWAVSLRPADRLAALLLIHDAFESNGMLRARVADEIVAVVREALDG